MRRSRVFLEVNWTCISWKKIGRWEHWVCLYPCGCCLLSLVCHSPVGLVAVTWWVQLEYGTGTLLKVASVTCDHFNWFQMCPFPPVTKPVIPFACVFAVALYVFHELENWVKMVECLVFSHHLFIRNQLSLVLMDLCLRRKELEQYFKILTCYKNLGLLLSNVSFRGWANAMKMVARANFLDLPPQISLVV